jgi:hypothetical protein
MRPAPNHSQATALVEQLTDAHSFQAYVVILDKGKHVLYRRALDSVGGLAGWVSFLAQGLQRFAYHFLDGTEAPGVDLFLNKSFLLTGQIDIHGC